MIPSFGMDMFVQRHGGKKNHERRWKIRYSNLLRMLISMIHTSSSGRSERLINSDKAKVKDTISVYIK